MRRIANKRKADSLTLMFPHTMDLKRIESTNSDDPMADEGTTEKALVEKWPCSVQSLTDGDISSVGGSLLKNEFLVLCPCIDGLDKFNGEDDSGTRTYTIVLHINGRDYKVEKSGDFGIEFIENQYVFDLCGYKIGCKIRVKTNTNLLL